MFKLYDYYISDNDSRQIAGLDNALKTKTFKLLDAIRQKKNTTIDTTIPPRTINYWTEVGVLDKSTLQESNKWHKFSFVDIVFIHIASKLRGFGMGLENIKNAKLGLYRLVSLTDENGNIVFKTPLCILESAILLAYTLKNHGNIYLLIDNSGHATYMTEESLTLNREHNVLPDAYIYLNLNELLNKNQIINNIQAKMHQEQKKYALNDNEKRVLDTLQDGCMEQIEIIKDSQHGKLLHMRTLKNITNQKNDDGAEFGETREIKQNGKIIRRTLKNTIKFK